MQEQPRRPAHILALGEAPIPSATLGVSAVFEALESKARICEFRFGSSVDPRPEDLAWADSVILVRGASPSERRLLAEAHRLGRRVATYMDDDLEMIPADARSAYFFSATTIRENLEHIIRSADDVLVCSDLLGEELERRHHCRPVRMLQPRPPRLPGETVPNPPQAPIAIGFLGSVDHSSFLDELLGDVLREIQKHYGDAIQMVFCGAEPRIARLLGARCLPFESDLHTWRRTALGLGLQIGLAPLRDTVFHQRKYWNKYLEYGSLGLAGIYTNIPPNGEVVRDGSTGLLCANEPEKWHASLRSLVDDPERRRKIGHAAYLDVESRFSAGALIDHWQTALAPLLSHRAPTRRAEDVRLRAGALWHLVDRLSVYGIRRFTERVVGRMSGRLRPG